MIVGNDQKLLLVFSDDNPGTACRLILGISLSPEILYRLCKIIRNRNARRHYRFYNLRYIRYNCRCALLLCNFRCCSNLSVSRCCILCQGRISGQSCLRAFGTVCCCMVSVIFLIFCIISCIRSYLQNADRRGIQLICRSDRINSDQADSNADANKDDNKCANSNPFARRISFFGRRRLLYAWLIAIFLF